MPTHLTLNELLDLAARHTAHEFSHDIDALMATVYPHDPCWGFEPIGCEITTFAAVAEMYRRMFPTIAAIKQAPVINMWFADDGFIGEVQITKSKSDGSQVAVSQFSWCEFTGDLISGECNYIDAADVAYLADALGDSFFSHPGVSVMTLSYPVAGAFCGVSRDANAAQLESFRAL